MKWDERLLLNRQHCRAAVAMECRGSALPWEALVGAVQKHTGYTYMTSWRCVGAMVHEGSIHRDQEGRFSVV